MDWNGLKQGKAMSCCEHDNKLSGLFRNITIICSQAEDPRRCQEELCSM